MLGGLFGEGGLRHPAATSSFRGGGEEQLQAMTCSCFAQRCVATAR